MSTLLPVRTFNRSQRVRINGKQLSATTTTYVNIDNPIVRRDWAKHSAVGAVVPVGTPITAADNGTIAYGGVVTQGSNATDLILAVTAGGGKKSDGTTGFSFAAATPTVTAADATNPRIDRVVVNANTGAVTIIAGTPAASPVAPAVTANNVSLALVSVPANDTAITNDQITDVRP